MSFSTSKKVHSAIFIMSDFVEQRDCIKSCLRNEYSTAETLRMLQKAFDDQMMSNKKKKNLVLKNRRLTIRDLVVTVGISKESVNTILKEVLCLRCVKSRLVRKTLNLFMGIWPKIQPISFRNHRIRLI